MKSTEVLLPHQQDRYFQPHLRVQDDLEAVYQRNEIVVGWPLGVKDIYDRPARKNTVGIVGVQFGDEGKGRIVDNKLDHLLHIPGVTSAYVIRFQGGNNAGHTVYTEEGQKVPLHQVPSGILHPEAVGIMDSGMIIHMEDLKTEITDAEKIVGDLRTKLILSEDAMLCTDLERAEEVFLREKSSGKSEGGTGRGISPTVAHSIDRQGSFVHDLFAENWQELFSRKYDVYSIDFAAYGKDIAQFDVPDFKATRETGKEVKRKVGSKDEYLGRLESVRQWFIERDATVSSEKGLIQNTFAIHRNIDADISAGVIFEGAQSVGLHRMLGRRPDVTSTDTSLYGIQESTGHWKQEQITEGIGIIKLTYMSSVGAGKPVTMFDIPKKDVLAQKKEQVGDQWKNWDTDAYWQEIQGLGEFTDEQKIALWTREVAKEKGTTTGRYRDICALDLELIRYNARLGGINMLAGTHLDIARADQKIQVCTHYTDKKGNYVPYQPGLRHQQGLVPHYVYVDGFDGKEVSKAHSFDELPDNAKKLLSLIQRQTGYPIVMVTTGPERKDMIEIPKVPDKEYKILKPQGTIYTRRKNSMN